MRKRPAGKVASRNKATARPGRPKRDPLAREWVPLPVSARILGFDWRTIRKHIEHEDFVRVLGERWYVRHAGLLEWWERQRPRRPKRAARGGR
jgi:hypothetical protein